MRWRSGEPCRTGRRQTDPEQAEARRIPGLHAESVVRQAVDDVPHPVEVLSVRLRRFLSSAHEHTIEAYMAECISKALWLAGVCIRPGPELAGAASRSILFPWEAGESFC